jgi:hypothetical protein
VCKSKLCITEFKHCCFCDFSFCSGHYEQHEKIVHIGKYKLSCESVKCHINGGLNDKGMQEFAPILLHTPALLELRLRMEVNRKLWNRL